MIERVSAQKAASACKTISSPKHVIPGHGVLTLNPEP